MHAAAETEARSLLERARERFELEEEMISDVTPAVGAHVGPGTLAICYCVGV
jgi:fatty acid-binding protein DegV